MRNDAKNSKGREDGEKSKQNLKEKKYFKRIREGSHAKRTHT